MTVAMPIGTATAFVLTGHYFNDKSMLGDNRENLNDLLKTQSIIFTSVYLFFQIVFREKPEHPPSAVAEAPIENRRFGEVFSVMKENRAFMLLCISFALMFGFYVSLGNLISSIFSPFGLSPSEISLLGLYLLVAGIVGAVVISAFVDRTGTYKMTMIVLSLLNTIFLTAVNQTVYHIDYSYALFLASLILMGFSSVSYIPLCFSFAAEVTFPLQPALINGAMLLAGQLSAFVQSLAFSFCIDVLTTDKDGVPLPDDVLLQKRQDRVWWTLFIMIGITAIALIINLFIKEDLRRLNYDK